MTTGTSTNNVALRDQDPYFKPMNAKIHPAKLFRECIRPGLIHVGRSDRLLAVS